MVKEKNELKNLLQVSGKDMTALKEEINNSNNKLLVINDINVKIEKEKVIVSYKLELLEGQMKEVDKLKLKLEEENKFLRNHVEGKNLEVTKLEEICAHNLLTSQQKITNMEKEKDILIDSNSSLKRDKENLEGTLILNENNHATSMGELLSKLTESNENCKVVSLDNSNKSKETTKNNDDIDIHNQLIEKNTIIMTLQSKLTDVETSKTNILNDYNEIKDRLAAHILKSIANEENSEAELKEMESQLKGFVEVCNSTRQVLLVAQDDLKDSEVRRGEDFKLLEKEVKDLENSKILLITECEQNRVKMVSMEVDYLNTVNQMEIKYDHLQGLLDSSLQSNKRIQQHLNDNNSVLLSTKSDYGELIKKKDIDFNTMQSNLENELELTKNKLLSALEEISFFEKEREDDIDLVHEKLNNNSVNARRKISVDFDNERENFEVDERRSRTNSSNLTPVVVTDEKGGNGNGNSDSNYFTNVSQSTSPLMKRRLQTDSPMTSTISAVKQIMILKDRIEELEIMGENNTNDEYNVLNERLESALVDLENMEINKDRDISTLIEKLEIAQGQNNMLIEECEEMRRLLLNAEIIEEQVRKQILNSENDREQVQNALIQAELALQNAIDEKEGREEGDLEITLWGIHKKQKNENNENGGDNSSYDRNKETEGELLQNEMCG